MRASVSVGLALVFASLAPARGEDAVSTSVGALAQALERWPARPVSGMVQMGLYLVRLSDGKATLIAAEPEPHLRLMGTPAWSNDGKTILFTAKGGNPNAPIFRMKTISLSNGRPVVHDLGKGGMADLSPDGERILFFDRKFDEKDPGGICMMRKDGTRRELLGPFGEPIIATYMYGRPRWSPDGRSFLVSTLMPQCQLSIVGVDAASSGPVVLGGRQIRAVPTWVGPGEILASLWPVQGNQWEIALLDVTIPARASIKEIWWTQKDETITWPTYAVYHAPTNRVAFCGVKGNFGDSLYIFERGKEDSLKRVEKEGSESEICDLAFSPDGRYLLFCSTRGSETRIPRGRAHSARVPAITGIKIDGDLADWPAAMPRYPIDHLDQTYPTISPGDRQHAFLATSANLSACFMVGYDPREQLVHLAVIVRDDKLVIGNTSPWDTDSIEVYLDGTRSEGRNNFPALVPYNESFDPGDMPVQLYAAIPGKGRVYGIKKSAGVERGEENPTLAFGDIKKTRTKMAFRREGDVTIYEWSLQPFDHFPDEPTRLEPGVRIGFDLRVCDRDAALKNPGGPQEPESNRTAIVSWAPPFQLSKQTFPGALGELVLDRAP